MDEEQAAITGDEGEGFTCLWPVERLPSQGRHVKLVPESSCLPALARQIGVDALESLSADLLLRPRANGELVLLSGTVRARVQQTCGITLQPVFSDISVSIERIYSFSAEQEEYTPGSEIQLDVDGEEPPDPVIDGHVDLALAVVEQLVLAVDPFPRLPGAEFVPPAAAPAGPGSPFAVLSALKTAKIDES